MYSEEKKINKGLEKSLSMQSKEGFPRGVLFFEDFMPHSHVKRKRR